MRELLALVSRLYVCEVNEQANLPRHLLGCSVFDDYVVVVHVDQLCP